MCCIKFFVYVDLCKKKKLLKKASGFKTKTLTVAHFKSIKLN